jgi:hypothetical protein
LNTQSNLNEQKIIVYLTLRDKLKKMHYGRASDPMHLSILVLATRAMRQELRSNKRPVAGVA